MPSLFSVVIPAYNQADFLRVAIDSVLKQTYSDFELIVVNDASPDHTEMVVKEFNDARIKYIVHDQNKGLPATRNTGMRASTGEWIALLDSDDYFHPQKLEVHAAFLNQHPEISVTYNPRFDLNYSDTTIRNLSRPPSSVGLIDFLFGYPFAPSDMVIRRSVVDEGLYFDEFFRNGGEDLEYPAALALAGYQFASVDRALNYRRHHSGRFRKNLDLRIRDVQLALKKIYSDPRCPEDIRQLGETPLIDQYIVHIYHAWIQNRTEEGQQLLERLMQLDSQVLDGQPSRLFAYFLQNSIADENDSHEVILHKMVAQLPEVPVNIDSQLEWAIREGYLVKGVRAAIWDRREAVDDYFQRAHEVGSSFDSELLKKVAHQLVGFEIEMSEFHTKAALERLLPYMRQLTPHSQYRKFLGELYAKRAFENYRRNQLNLIPKNVIQAVRYNPDFLLNKGLYSIFFHSLIKSNIFSIFGNC